MPTFKTLSPFMAIGGRRNLASDDSGFITVENEDDIARCRAHPYCAEVMPNDEKPAAKEVKSGRSNATGAGSKA